MIGLSQGHSFFLPNRSTVLRTPEYCISVSPPCLLDETSHGPAQLGYLISVAPNALSVCALSLARLETILEQIFPVAFVLPLFPAFYSSGQERDFPLCSLL